MKLGDIVYYRDLPVTVVRKASPYVFGYLAKKQYVMVRVSKDVATKLGRPKVRLYAISADKLKD